ncbi:MAG: protein kinase [Deltaproteobacteria bacterium]|nr:protein kinase [Deltaproteobacteria bacterium]
MTELGSAPPLRPGTVIAGRYVIDSLLGEGGMGRVYQATQVNLRRDIALKLLDNNNPDREMGHRRFLREARVASALRHPNAVEIYDVGIDGAHVFIAMELLTGTVLRDLIEEEVRLPLADALELSSQIADLLIAAHALPLVHRDLKPENIFVEHDRNGALRARVVDFGLAFIAGDEETGRLTKEGLVVGTPAFLSPEQARGAHVGPAADIYSLGCVMYEMLTGQVLFRGSQMNILTQHIYVAPISPRERMPEAGIPSDLDDLVLRMLSKSPEDRPTAATLVEAIARVKGTLAGQRHRGRDDRMLQGRAERMISVPAAQAPPKFDPDAVKQFDAEGIQVGVIGTFEDELWFGLASNGLFPEVLEAHQDPRAVLCDVVLSVVDNLEHLSALTKTGVPVVAVTGANRTELLAELLRRGVSDVLCPPVRADELARKLRRAVERNRRQLERNR